MSNPFHDSLEESQLSRLDQQLQLEPRELPENRFELELEFVQALASPAYVHFLATSARNPRTNALLANDTKFRQYLKYLQNTYAKRPEYNRLLWYPHCLYMLDLLLNRPNFIKEMSLVQFRNFFHQQQFSSWQQRHSTLYGCGTPRASEPQVPPADDTQPER